MSTLHVGLVQHACTTDPVENRARSMQGIRRAAADGAELIILQELHATRYFCQTEDVAVFDLAETIPGPSTEQFGALAAELGVVLVLSLFERRAVGLYHNTAVVIERDGTLAGTYRKSHIPDDPGYYEKFYFAIGDTGFEPISCSVGRLGLMVCWDQWFPEGARLMALAGADLLIYPSAIGWAPEDDADEKQRQRDAWIAVQRGHAVANGLPLIATNRIGHEPDPSDVTSGSNFWGNSFVVGPQGEFLGRCGEGEESLVVKIDRLRSENVRRIWPFLRDRRIDQYADLLKRYRDR